MSVRELELHDECVRLDAENRELRQWLTNFLLVIAQRDELLELGLQEIQRRWPEAKGATPLPSSTERVAA